ncbi:type II toxin-antitoxin system RatA family toxin [Pseudaeromonas sp. ZJS20]|uniref:type II toxin-antitoxin system RatA family toxin n=1 Tax=Pseudaeromonas aegiceratis TaxID=3153928 RepID=UPI00390C9BA7
MAQLHRSALVMYSAEEMYALVNDVVAYPQFLPGCVASRVISQSELTMVAEVSVAKAGINKQFTTKNTLVPGREILMELVEGPFRRLHGVWHFTPLDEAACKVALSLEFEFSSRLIETAFGAIFRELAGAMVKAFCQRAKEVYGVR